MQRIYHYTTPSGLDGIIRSRSVWASDYRFLNDASEFRYGVETFYKHFRTYRLSKQSPSATRLFDGIEQRLEFYLSLNGVLASNLCIFVASFTEEPDLLSQWRGYNGGRGFSLGCNSQWVSENSDVQGFSFVPVIYEESQQAEAIFARIKVLAQSYLDNLGKRDAEGDINYYWTNALKLVAALKHPTFKEERERRAVKAQMVGPQMSKPEVWHLG